jgi:hypothetical protein
MAGFRGAAFLLLILCAVSACGIAGEALPTYRYRLTVEVNTPQGLRSGSSVIEVKTRRLGEAFVPDARGYRKRIEGEAVAVDLGRRGTLFVLLRSRWSEAWPEHVVESVLPRLRQGTRPQDEEFQAVLRLRGAHAIPRFRGAGATRMDNYPLLVRFADPRRPDTANLVDPDRLDAAFGPGVALRRITVELTDAPVTRSLSSRLPFLREEDNQVGVDRTFDGSQATQHVGLGRSHFERDF